MELGRNGTFVLGVGAQKAGTTWLHEYLADSPEFAEGFKKEYHVLDHPDIQKHWQLKAYDRAKRMLDKLEAGDAGRAGPLQWASFYADPEAYYDYFSGLLTRPGIRVTGDISPLYGQLSAERLVEVRQRFAERDIRVVAVFLMRDPVERLWSQARMILRDSEGATGTAEEWVAERFRRPRFDGRTRYDAMLARLEEAFAPGDLYVDLYERLFDRETLRRLTDLLGMTFHEPDLQRRTNVTDRSGSLEPELAARVADHYRDSYAVVQRRFPEVDLAAVWPSAALLDAPPAAER